MELSSIPAVIEGLLSSSLSAKVTKIFSFSFGNLLKQFFFSVAR